MKTEHHYRWRCQTVTGRWYTTRFSCTEEFILGQHPEAKRLDHTLVVREVCTTEDEIRERARTLSGCSDVLTAAAPTPAVLG